MQQVRTLEYHFLGNVVIAGKIRCETPLHIGGGDVGYRIGGLDQPVIRDPRTEEPYVPGSSLRGRMRFWLEWATDKVRPQWQRGDGGATMDAPPHQCSGIFWNPIENKWEICSVCLIFGSSPQDEPRLIGPTRLLVRDARLTSESRSQLMDLWEREGIPMTESKTENTIDRVTSTAANPRPIERVLQGTEFAFEMIYSIYNIPTPDYLQANNENQNDGPQMTQGKEDVRRLKQFFQAMRLVESSSLGGDGSRGSGQITFHIEFPPRVYSPEQYLQRISRERPECFCALSELDDDGYLSRVREALNIPI